MTGKTIIPIYDLYKTLEPGLQFEFTKLEESYNPYDATSPHRHNYYEVLYFNEGGGWHEIDFNSFSIGKNSLHFISPEQVHLLRRDHHVTGFVLSFTKDFFYEESGNSGFIDNLPFFENPSAKPVVTLGDSSSQKEIPELLLKIQTEYFSDRDDKEEMLRIYLSAMLIHAKRMYVPETVSGKPLSTRSDLTRRFKKLVEVHFRQNKSVSDYAEMLNITAGHLNDTVQKDSGKTASDIIHERIILEAKRLLYHSPKSVKEIAYELKYEDPSHFNRFFKNQTNFTPEQFRQHIREKYH